jgi:hypothetical protein
MPEPVSTIGLICLAGYAALNSYARGGSAVSDEAAAAQKAAMAVAESAERSQALFGEKSVALSQLQALATECGEADWDGSGAAPVDELAIQNAIDIVRILPSGFPLPEFAPEPDGSVSLDWIDSRSRIFSVSVSIGSRLAYAWLDGSDRGHGVARFDGERIPMRILQGIQDIMGYGNATFWAA